MVTMVLYWISKQYHECDSSARIFWPEHIALQLELKSQPVTGTGSALRLSLPVPKGADWACCYGRVLYYNVAMPIVASAPASSGRHIYYHKLHDTTFPTFYYSFSGGWCSMILLTINTAPHQPKRRNYSLPFSLPITSSLLSSPSQEGR